jgi:hypothetical protein
VTEYAIILTGFLVTLAIVIPVTWQLASDSAIKDYKLLLQVLSKEELEKEINR